MPALTALFKVEVPCLLWLHLSGQKRHVCSGCISPARSAMSMLMSTLHRSSSTC
jgi:hypothetical protein